MSGKCDECGSLFDREQWDYAGSTGPPRWAGAQLYRCPNCGNEQTRPKEDYGL